MASYIVFSGFGNEVAGPQTQTPFKSGVATDQEVTNMWGLAVQPLEVLRHIFTYVDVSDTAQLSTTCRYVRDCIASDNLLWREQYLKLFDEPAETPSSWRDALKSLLEMRSFLRYGDRNAKEDALEDVANTSIKLISQTKYPCPTKNQSFLAELFATRSNRSCFLSRSSLFRRAGSSLDVPADSEDLRQLSAKLHVYYGKQIELDEADLEDESAQMIHPCARSRVYDLRRYKRKNFWGPFMDDGSGKVDWEKVQSIMIVLAHEIQMCTPKMDSVLGLFCKHEFGGVGRDSFQSVTRPNADNEDKDEFADKDPYGVRGTWMRVVNFLDYHDLFAYNFQPPFLPPDQERRPNNMKEAIRFILLTLKVTRIEEPSEKDWPGMPRVHFGGISKAITNHWDPNANSQIRGCVHKTKHGDVRWTTFSVFGGEERWRSESVQIGGENSARGTIGNWFDKNFDPHGPAGPTAIWKISNDIVKLDGADASNGLLHHDHTRFWVDSDPEDDEWEETEEEVDDEVGEEGSSQEVERARGEDEQAQPPTNGTTDTVPKDSEGSASTWRQ